jgi:signal transduction histidine kinase
VALLGRAVANLLENAVNHNHDGGVLSVRTGRRGRWSEMTVVNDGDDLTEAEVALLFEPFHRGRRTRGHGRAGDRDDTGTGLGLSIVRAVLRAHGGQVTIRPRPAGGLDVVLRLPAPSADSG